MKGGGKRKKEKRKNEVSMAVARFNVKREYGSSFFFIATRAIPR